MKFVMFGSGGVGGYYGARLVQAGNEVVFVARGAHAARMREKGLSIKSETGDALISPVNVVEDPARAGDADVIFVAVKLWDSESAANAIKPIIGPRTTVVSLQNGVDKDDVLAGAAGREHVVGGITHIGAVIAEPGVIAHTGKLQRVTLGELAKGPPSPRVIAIVAALARAKIEAVASDDIVKATWEKFVFLTSLSDMTALTRKPVGPVRDNPATRAMLRDALEETAAVARAEGVPLAEDLPEKQLKMIDGLNPAMTSSMAQDLARGKRLELEWLSGAVVRRGEARGQKTPVHRAIHAALVLHANP
ncbi:MAG: ketopantoate reductase family protein [Myxococcales bacterium]